MTATNTEDRNFVIKFKSSSSLGVYPGEARLNASTQTYFQISNEMAYIRETAKIF